MRRSLAWGLVAVATALVPLRHEGDRALAQETPPPVVTAVPPPAPQAEKSAAEIPSAAPSVPTVTADCDVVLQQALVELDFWRAQVALLTTVKAGRPETAAPALSMDRPRVAQVAATVKEMKAKDAALVIVDWDDGLATEVLARLPARASGAIAAALPPAHAARLLARLSLLAVPKDEP